MPSDTPIVDVIRVHLDMLDQLRVFPAYQGYSNRQPWWNISCTKEQLNFLVLKGVQILLD